MLPFGGIKQGATSILRCAVTQTLNQDVASSLGGLGAWTSHRTATKKAGGSAKQGVGSLPKHLGMKMSAGELAFPGMIILRQRGTKFHPGQNVGIGRDHTIFATRVGTVRVSEAEGPRGKERRVISVEPLPEVASAAARRAGAGAGSDQQVVASHLATASQDAQRLVEAELVQRRAQVKRAMLQGGVPLEPALFFRLPTLGGRLTWLERTDSAASVKSA